jgi:hypothetical protein
MRKMAWALGMWLLAAAAAEQEAVPVPLTTGVTRILERDRIPPNGREVFTFSATAGQTLLIEWDPKKFGDYDPDRKFGIFVPGATESLAPRYDEQWLSTLTKTGICRIVVETPARKPYVLRITLIDARDLRLDPGIAPGTISLDLSPLGVAEKFSVQPFSPTPAALTDESWPASLALVSRPKIELRIMSTEAIRNTYWRNEESEWTKRLALLDSSLTQGAKMASPFDLPMTRIDEAGLNFAAMEKRLDGKSFRALRWVAGFSMMSLLPANPMTYIAEGISRDGRYFLLVRAEISNPAVDGLPDMEEGPQMEAIKTRVAAKLAAAPAASFKPSLATLDAIVQSIKLP